MKEQDGVLRRTAGHIERFLEGGQTWVAIAAAAVLLILQIPGMDDAIANLGLEDNRRLRTLVALIILTSILLELRQLRGMVGASTDTRVHFPDPQEMYEALTEKARSIGASEHQEVQVLGLTLYSAWPVLSFLLARPEIHGWRVKLATLAPNAQAPCQWVPNDWPDESATILKQVRDFAKGAGKEHNHQIEVFEYDFTPAVHGLRLGTGDLFVSVLHWQPDGRLGKDKFSYDYVLPHDASSGAAAMRALFANWFDRAVASHQAAASDGS